MSNYTKPLPTLNDENRPFWEATKAHNLQMQRCSECGHIRYPIGPVCTKCLSSKFSWVQMSGKGKIISYVVIQQMYNKAFAEDLPFNCALVELDEGPRMISNIVGIPNDEIKSGMKIEATFDDVTDTITIPRFKVLRDQ